MSWPILHDRSNEPTGAVAACILPDASRAWARLSDPGDLMEMLSADPIGRTVLFGDAGDRLA